MSSSSSSSSSSSTRAASSSSGASSSRVTASSTTSSSSGSAYSPPPPREFTVSGGPGRFKLQVASDLHFEFHVDRHRSDLSADPDASSDESSGTSDSGTSGYRLYQFRDIVTPVGPVLALLGDVSDIRDRGPDGERLLTRFLSWCARHWELVLFGAGNHEYYGGRSFNRMRRIMRDACAEAGDNVIFLDRTSLLINGVRVLGTTLWSHVVKDAGNEINDMDNIYVRDADGVRRRWTVDDHNRQHRTEVAWLRQAIHKSVADGEPMSIVLTHHSPSKKHALPSWFHRYFRGTVEFFATDMDQLFKNKGKSNVALWCFGHTHGNVDTRIHGTHVVSNQRGYPEHFTRGSHFRPDFFIKVKASRGASGTKRRSKKKAAELKKKGKKKREKEKEKKKKKEKEKKDKTRKLKT